MIQQVLDDPASGITLTSDDLRGLTPLTYSHVNPYGTFRLDMTERLPLAVCHWPAGFAWSARMFC
jgi:hypothetical protein